MNIHTESERPPCKHMESLIQDYLSGEGGKLRSWYVLAHAARCTGCGNFLTRMRVTLEALRQARERETNSGAIDRLREQIRQLEQGS